MDDQGSAFTLVMLVKISFDLRFPKGVEKVKTIRKFVKVADDAFIATMQDVGDESHPSQERQERPSVITRPVLNGGI